jgi:3-dehydroquinate synthase
LNNNIVNNFENYKKTWVANTELPVSFTLTYSTNIFDSRNHDLISYGDSQRKIVVVDKIIYNLYSDQIKNYFDNLKIEYLLHIVDSTEINKNWENCEKILRFFEDAQILRRSEPVLAIGGGVLIDIVGFCCSIYRRGIPYIKVPTTLLAIVDASVGAKVGIDHFGKRNRLGAYFPPIAALLDKKFIKTQPKREIVNGIAEIFKLALIKQNELFVLLEENYEQLLDEKFQYGAVPNRVINLAITGMIEELAPNLWEKKLDRCVDFGHSFSPLIEMNNIPDILHGESVAIDCIFSSCISFNRGYIDFETLKRILNAAKNLGLPTFHQDFTDFELMKLSLLDTMKHRNNNQYLPLPIEIGNYKIINDLSDDEIKNAITVFKTI